MSKTKTEFLLLRVLGTGSWLIKKKKTDTEIGKRYGYRWLAVVVRYSRRSAVTVTHEYESVVWRWR